ncbi:hypothetical protein NMY22_g6510 [Coprinellus aureogranulatus]|nr:hypothetical protein NMY22_g6510 [Coprinellus aureogranulatus]
MSPERSPSPGRRDVDMDMDPRSPDTKSDAKVVVVTNLTRNVVEAHLQTVFGFYGEISKIDLPLFGKSGQNRGKAALEFIDNESARKAVSHMDGGTPQPFVPTPYSHLASPSPVPPPPPHRLGEIAKADPKLLIQTHISENPSEVAYTNELFPEAGSYAGVYDQFGLLREGTILAHAVHLTPGEVDLIKQRGAGISHCPTSNFNLRSGIAPVGKFLDKGIKVGLGTDVSGGFSTSILSEIQHASMASKVLQFTAEAGGTRNGFVQSEEKGKFENKQLPIPTLCTSLRLAAPHCAGWRNTSRIGLWGSGVEADVSGSREDLKEGDLEEWLERFFFTGDDRNIDRVYVQGRWIGGRSFTGKA